MYFFHQDVAARAAGEGGQRSTQRESEKSLAFEPHVQDASGKVLEIRERG